jgi:DNA-binding response OmpR family regulator
MLILVVEDDALNAFMIEQSLVHAGHEVLGPVGRAADAIATIELRRPELVLIDIDLGPSMSGIDLARDIRARWNIPGVFVTGQIEVARAHTNCAIGLLPKPFSPETLCSAVDFLSGVIMGSRRSGPRPKGLELFIS